ncbi:MAG: hypothetical protein IT379_34085 [Deltaproteobacteria bacterium]|nr:hypothetical protein [Deltaproteobacteria bacterium]
MCRRVHCSRCGKPSFAGCGAHVEQVLGDVPRDDRCKCHEQRTADVSAGRDDRSWIARLFGVES